MCGVNQYKLKCLQLLRKTNATYVSINLKKNINASLLTMVLI